jgi:Holliday junction resolvasome RuvABC endonuclease subunit
VAATVGKLPADAADALAVALTHAHHAGMAKRMAKPSIIG